MIVGSLQIDSTKITSSFRSASLYIIYYLFYLVLLVPSYIAISPPWSLLSVKKVIISCIALSAHSYLAFTPFSFYESKNSALQRSVPYNSRL